MHEQNLQLLVVVCTQQLEIVRQHVSCALVVPVPYIHHRDGALTPTLTLTLTPYLGCECENPLPASLTTQQRWIKQSVCECVSASV